MDKFILENLLDKIQGCTFANLDSETEPSPGIRKVTTGTRIILFTNKNVNGYENMVKRRLIEAGKNPDNFVLSDLPWGERIPNTPLIQNKGKFYLQCIVLIEGQSRYFIGPREVRGDGLMLRTRASYQGLPPGDAVNVACYNLEHIKKITLMGETVVADQKGILSVSGS